MSGPPYPVRHAGLWRCCVETAQRTEPREPERLIECEACRDGLRSRWTREACP